MTAGQGAYKIINTTPQVAKQTLTHHGQAAPITNAWLYVRFQESIFGSPTRRLLAASRIPSLAHAQRTLPTVKVSGKIDRETLAALELLSPPLGMSIIDVAQKDTLPIRLLACPAWSSQKTTEATPTPSGPCTARRRHMRHENEAITKW